MVDDERALARLVAGYLDKAGYAVRTCHTGPDAVEIARAESPEVIVLDLNLPGLDGVEVCRSVRAFSDCYILMLTARNTETAKLAGLDVGADDYMTKPFSPRELVARVQTLLRRPRSSSDATANGGVNSDPAYRVVRVYGDLKIDLTARVVTLAGREVELTPTEFALLAVLSARPRMAFTREQLLDQVWGSSSHVDERLVDVHIGHLRRKLEDDPPSSRFVRTIRGVGYRMGEG